MYRISGFGLQAIRPFLTTHVTVCVCHAELKGYFLTYLLVRVRSDLTKWLTEYRIG